MTALALATPVLFAWRGAAQAVSAGDKYVAIGHSFVAGQSIPDAIEGTCARSTNNYPNLVARKLKLALTDVSCGSAVIDNVLSVPQGANPPQLDAVTPDTKLVTITIGSNDVGYTGANITCAAAGLSGSGCVGSVLQPQDMEASLAALPGKLSVMLEAIKAKAPDARVILLPDPRVLPPSATPCPPSVAMQPADLRFMVDVGDQLHTIMKQSAASAKVDYIESYSPKGHDACAVPAKRWIEGQEPASPTIIFHPNAAGMKAQAKMIVRELRSS
jgi:lysophospholipase L1-like esterase